jgi:hypothetical protein
MCNRLYHVVAINEKTGRKTYCTIDPMPHHQACNNLRAFTDKPGRRIQLEEFNPKVEHAYEIRVNGEYQGWLKANTQEAAIRFVRHFWGVSALDNIKAQIC